MDADRVNKWLTLAANLGVIAGIVFLAVELRQNTELMRAQSRTEMAKESVAMLTLNVDNAEYMETILKGLKGDEMNEIQEDQFHRTYNAWIMHWNNLAYLNRVGLYDESEYLHQINVIREEIKWFPGHMKHWCANREYVASLELIEAIEGDSGSSFCPP